MMRRQGYDDQSILAAKFPAGVLWAYGFDAGLLRAQNYPVDRLKAAGYSCAALLHGGFSHQEVKAAGFDIVELRVAQVGIHDLRAAGFSDEDVLRAGFTAKALKAAGFDAGRLFSGGRSIRELIQAGFGAVDMKAAGFSAADLKRAGVEDVVPLRAAGFRIPELKAAGYEAVQLRRAGYGFEALSEAGFDDRKLLNAGFSEELARSVLMELFSVTNGPRWRIRLNWGTSRPLGEWFGVTTERAFVFDDTVGEIVTGLDLSDNGLYGPIPSRIWLLLHLRSLSFARNSLFGSVPDSIRMIPNLGRLDFSHNPLLALPSAASMVPLPTISIHSSSGNPPVTALKASGGGGVGGSASRGGGDLSSLKSSGSRRSSPQRVRIAGFSDEDADNFTPTSLRTSGGSRSASRTSSRNSRSGSNGFPGLRDGEFADMSMPHQGRFSPVDSLVSMPGLSSRMRSGGAAAVVVGARRSNYHTEETIVRVSGHQQAVSRASHELSPSSSRAATLADFSTSTSHLHSNYPHSESKEQSPTENELGAHRDYLSQGAAEEYGEEEEEEEADFARALLDLFQATRGSRWKSSKGWGTALPLREWFGVSADQAGVVIKLTLASNNLMGSIPDTIDFLPLTHMRELDLR